MSAPLVAPARPARTAPVRLPRPLHPVAWWLWALGLAAAASRTTNPLLLGVVIGVIALVVARRRGDAPWARGLGGYLVLGLVVIGMRVGFRVLLGGGDGTHVLFRLPEVPLPEAAAGIRLGGAVTAEAVLAALYDGLRLACLLLCVGAANLLADPKRLLKAVPGALHGVGTSITVALSLAPQLVESTLRVRRARRLRGTARTRRHRVEQVLVPVLEDALDRSLRLAAAMDVRGYGRVGTTPRRERLLTGALVLGGLVAACGGTYGLLDAAAPAALGLSLLLAGLVLAGLGLARGGRQTQRTVYRPDPFGPPEWAVAGCGLVAAVGVGLLASFDPAVAEPSLYPLRWPELPVAAAAAVLVAALPAVLAPPLAVAPAPRAGIPDTPGTPDTPSSPGSTGREARPPAGAAAGGPGPGGAR